MNSSGGRRVVVVTGANEGIGYHLLTALRGDGYRVAGLDIEGSSSGRSGTPTPIPCASTSAT